VKKLLNLTNLLFLVLVIADFLPTQRTESKPLYLIGLVVLIQFVYMLKAVVPREQDSSARDIAAITYAALLLWDLFTTKLNLLDKLLFPAPGIVIALFIEELPVLLKGLVSSLQLLVSGYGLALVVAVPLALLIGWRKRLFRAVNPITKVLGPIPPIVYIPYAIVLLPSFKLSSIFIIFIGAFWPIFINTLNGVFNVEKRIIDSAKVLAVTENTMLFKIILPGAMPEILSGATIGLVMSFILLTAAEMIGATSGLGWYVKYFSDFADYPRVIVGIVFIGMVVTGITFLFGKLESYLLRWRAN
jgi:NitT/TauT family transport system permease protein